MMIQETCGCGASLLFEGDTETDPKVEMRLWRKNHQHKPPVKDDDEEEEGIESSLPQHSEGNNHTQLERRYESDSNHEMNANDRPGHYGQAISLKWQPPKEQKSCTQ